MIDTLVISIGGIKGIAFVGVLEELFGKISFNSIKHIIGSSVGSIIGLLLSINYTTEEIYTICTEIDFSQFTLNSPEKLHENINEENICCIDNLVNFGLDNGNGMIRLLRSIVQIKCSVDITFKEHFEKFGKDLTVVATNIDKLRAEYFNYKNTPDVKIIDAVRLSISIPIIYTIQKHQDTNYTDGGISDYYPINYYDKTTSLGICLFKSRTESIQRTNTNIFNYVLNICNTLEIYMNSLLKELYEEYTIFIDIDKNIKINGISKFKMEKECKAEMYNLGKKLFTEYYTKYKHRF